MDFTWIQPGSSPTRILSVQRAEVIKAESDQVLALAGRPASGTTRVLVQRHNYAGKLSISLHMKTPEAVAIQTGIYRLRAGPGVLSLAAQA